jgi:predicted RNA-binding Zn ribbon-like protein
VSNFELIGGVTCLDFCNTLDGRRGFKTLEKLAHYTDLLTWSRQVGDLSASTAGRLRKAATRRPAKAAAVLARAIELREALARIFVACIARRRPARADLDALDRELRRGSASARVVTTAAGVEWCWQGELDALDQMLAPIARSAVELLTSSAIDRVRECCADTCGWLFLDVSKNRSRRWCDMRTCGNLEKVRRHRGRQRRARRGARNA